jgi:3-oxoadipate enol-lactonase
MSGAVPLHYTVDGPEEAPVLMMGASLGTTGEVWAPQVPALTARYRVVRYDHRGHGGSPAPPGPYTLEDLGGDVLSLLETLRIDRVRLAGMSLGGMLAAWVAARAPERVDRLALLATSPRFGSAQTWAEREAAVRAGGVASITEGALERWLPPGYAAAHPGTAAWVRRLLLATGTEGYAGCCAALATADLTPELPKITAPTLVIAGADDPVSPPAHSEALAAGIAGPARTEVVPDAAHLVGVAAPEPVNRLLLSFFEETP